MKKKSNRTHKSSKEKYYIPYLPDEVFENLTPELRKTQQEYRTYHKTLHGIRERINTNELLIKKLKGEIENDKYRIKKGANEKYPEDGYEELVGFRFEKLSHLYDDYKNSISITRKNRSSSSFKKNQEDLEKYGRLETTEGNMRKQFYGGKEISEIITFNAQIKSNNYLHSYINGDSSNKKIKNISLGTEEDERELNISKLRYHKVVIMTDADIDGSHIATLLLTFFFRYLKTLVENGYVYIATPPLYLLKRGKDQRYCWDENNRDSIIENMKGGKDVNVIIQRYKGLGEMNADQLWDTTMNPDFRTLKRVTIDSAAEADRVFSMLMGDDVPPRRAFIEANAKYANIDA